MPMATRTQEAVHSLKGISAHEFDWFPPQPFASISPTDILHKHHQGGLGTPLFSNQADTTRDPARESRGEN